MAPDTAVSAIPAQCLHMILCDIFCIGTYGVTFGNFIKWTFECVRYAAYDEVRSA